MLVANVVRRSRCGHGLLSADFFTDCLRRFCWHDACGANGKRSLGGGCAFCVPIGGFSDGKQCRFWGVCKLLCFRCPERRKIQGTYFKISALYFKIYGLYFLQHALCFFRCPLATKKHAAFLWRKALPFEMLPDFYCLFRWKEFSETGGTAFESMESVLLGILPVN